MAKIEMAYFENTLSQVFHGGERLTRELRLTAAEAEYLRETYPNARLVTMPDQSTEKAWYQVCLAAATA